MKERINVIGKLIRPVRDERGGTLAELAIIVPFLVIMLAGVSEFGRLFQSYTTLAKATRNSARYLSNYQPPYSTAQLNAATNLVVCGKVACAGGDELVKGMSSSKVCIEEMTSTVKVSVPRTSMSCTNGSKVPHDYQPIFDLGALLDDPTFSLELPLSPSTTMYYVNDL